LRTPAEFVEHPQLAARDRWRKIGLPNGSTVDALLPPVIMNGADPVLGDVPGLGAHNESLRAEFSDAPTNA